MSNKNIPFNLLKFTPSEDGDPLGMTIEVQPEFQDWFVKAMELEEWDDEKFSNWFKGFLGDAIKDHETLKTLPRNKMMTNLQRTDIWDNGDSHDE